MKRIAIIGGGISGLAAAYELEKQRKAGADIDWHLYEASPQLGGVVQTTSREGFVLESGPDGWVSEKPWARELAIELGLERELIYSNDATRKTYILLDGKLQAIPQGMRLFVPESLESLEGSELFSASACAAYAAELANAAALKAHSPFSQPEYDESAAHFVQRHFGAEVLDKLAAPLLSGVFGGDVAKLSARAALPAFIAMEREHGSLIAALQAKARSTRTPQPIFTSLRNGMRSLVDALAETLPAERVKFNSSVLSLKREGSLWCVRSATPGDKGRVGKSKRHVHQILLATSEDATRSLLSPLNTAASALLPEDASSAVLVAFAWLAETAGIFRVPDGFGFLAPPGSPPVDSETGAATNPQLLACTFVDQKFPHRAPERGRILRAFYGGQSCEALAHTADKDIAAMALNDLSSILGHLPEPAFSTVSRWPRSLPQYEVGHLERMAQLDAQIAQLPGLTLLGNSYRGVGLPDLVRDARCAASVATQKTSA